MKPFLPRVFHAGVIVSAAITRVGQSIELLFRSKADVARGPQAESRPLNADRWNWNGSTV